jgi:copper resistance protein C
VTVDRTTRSAARAALAAVLATGVLLVPAVPAAAHTRLESSDPGAGQQLADVPDQVRLVFSGGIDQRFARVALTPAGEPAQELPATVTGSVLTAALPEGAAERPGTWQIDYRVISADGHPVSGSVPFVVLPAAAPPTVPPSATATAAPTASAVPPPVPAAASGSSSEATGDETPVWPWAVGAAALLVAAALFLRLSAGRPPV